MDYFGPGLGLTFFFLLLGAFICLFQLSFFKVIIEHSLAFLEEERLLRLPVDLRVLLCLLNQLLESLIFLNLYPVHQQLISGFQFFLLLQLLLLRLPLLFFLLVGFIVVSCLANSRSLAIENVFELFYYDSMEDDLLLRTLRRYVAET